jgi:hypothetical protein
MGSNALHPTRILPVFSVVVLALNFETLKPLKL